MNTAIQIYTIISMTITSVCALAVTAGWLDEIIVARRYYKALRREIRDAMCALGDIYNNEQVPCDVVLQVLADLHYRRFIDWAQVRIDCEDDKNA